ncbi:MAG TPA: hypothetical protein VFZ34_25955 [Blastocatellia bacterium]|nr:hypothetical protein [Blastocatellia bacterium]
MKRNTAKLLRLLIGAIFLPLWGQARNLSAVASSPQFCNPAVVYYLVRDPDGKPLSTAELKAVSELLPESVGGATPYPGEISFQADGKAYFWREQAEWKHGNKVPALEFANAATCEMSLTEVTLTYHKQQMRLCFNLSVVRGGTSNRIVIDGLPFRAGTYALDLSGLSLRDNVMIPAARWKPVREKAIESAPPSNPNEQRKRSTPAHRKPRNIFL